MTYSSCETSVNFDLVAVMDRNEAADGVVFGVNIFTIFLECLNPSLGMKVCFSFTI